MTLFVGLDVSVKETAVCVVDDTGKVVCEQKVPTEPDDIVRLLASIGEDYGRVGIEADRLSQWLVNGLTAAGLPVVCVETRHMMALLKAQQINKSDRNAGKARPDRIDLPHQLDQLLAQHGVGLGDRRAARDHAIPPAVGLAQLVLEHRVAPAADGPAADAPRRRRGSGTVGATESHNRGPGSGCCLAEHGTLPAVAAAHASVG
jgi:Transposase